MHRVCASRFCVSLSFFSDASNIFYICSAACCIGICNAFSKTSYTSGDAFEFWVHECMEAKKTRWNLCVLANRTIYARLDCFFHLLLESSCALSVVCATAAHRDALRDRLPLGIYAERMISDRIFLFDKHEHWTIAHVAEPLFMLVARSSPRRRRRHRWSFGLVSHASESMLYRNAMMDVKWSLCDGESEGDERQQKVTPIPFAVFGRRQALKVTGRSSERCVRRVCVLIWDVLQLSLTVTSDASTTFLL